MHPLFAAKQATTIDHIGSGRFALNLVTGWYLEEMGMFGVTLLDHDGRYAMAEEWAEIVTRLWSDPEPFDFEGKFYQLKRAELAPKPIQRPRPPLMSAAGSERGRHFAAKYCDICFVALDTHDTDKLRAKVDRYRNFALAEYGREIQVWTNAYVYHGDTLEDGRALWSLAVEQQGDWRGATHMMETMGLTSQLMPTEAFEFAKKHFIAGVCGYPLIGGAEQIVEGLSKLEACGFDGVLLTWPRWVEGMNRFSDEVIPLLKQLGLRQQAGHDARR